MNSEDVVELSENEDSDCVLESTMYEDNIMNEYKKACENNPILTELIQTCFNLDNSTDMKKVINKILLDRYMKTNKIFIESKEFDKALKRAINLVKNDSTHKFSHIKDLCEILRKSTKKRVQLITLSNNNKDSGMSHKRKSETEGKSKVQKTEVIDLDSTENDFIINLDSSDSNLMSDHTLTGEKENDMYNENRSNEDKLLIPHLSLEVQEPSTLEDRNIRRIEDEIEICKKMIVQLEEQEVGDDSMNSPYIQSENYKARIVLLYKELCKLTGAEAVKRSTVRLKVLEGHPSGPVRRLEAFLNKNVGSDGHPPFPSFRDVVKCVLKANEQDGLGWSKQNIMNEATVLFTHCGRALQKSRQRREWRDLLSRGQPLADPADSDPALLARLEANRLDAARKEAEILERFTMMQNAPPKKATVPNKAVEAHENSNESEIDSSCDECSTEDKQNLNLPSQMVTPSKSNNNDRSIDASDATNVDTVVKIKKQFNSSIYQQLEELGDNYTTTVIDIEDSYVVIDISDSCDEDSD